MQERCWERLDIEPTADTAVIKKAYAKQLKFNKPDKNPKGFRELRAAYEQALNESYWYEEDEEESEYENEERYSEEICVTVSQNTPAPLSYDDSNDSEKDDEAYQQFPEEIPFTIAPLAQDLSLQNDVNDNDDNEKADEVYQQFPAEIPFTIAAPAQDLLSQNDSNDNDDNKKADEAYKKFPEEISFAIADPVAHSTGQYANGDDDKEADSEGYRDDTEERFDANEKCYEALESDSGASDFLDITSVWVASWNQAVRQEDAIIDGDDGDEHLLKLIQSQIETPRPLDEQNDLEETLLSWFDDQPPLFPCSYDWAKEHFDWNARLKHWSYNHYPWYMTESLNRRYEQTHYFHLPSAFRKFLLLHFPIVAYYWSAANLRDDSKDNPSSDSDDERDVVPIKRLDVFKGLFFPINVGELAYELNTLDQELTYYNQGEMAQYDEAADTGGKTFNAQYWQNESPLKDLNNWVFRRFIQLKDFAVIALGTVVSVVVLSSAFPSSWQNLSYDGLGGFITIALYYLFWQVQLRLFATPNDLVFDTPLVVGWRNSSIVLFIIGYILWIDIAELDNIIVISSPVYFLTHIAGASLCVAESLRSTHTRLVALLWHMIVLILLSALVIPFLEGYIGQLPLEDVNYLSPILWFVPMAALLLLNRVERNTELERFMKLVKALFGISAYYTLIVTLLFIISVPFLLIQVDLGFTATVIFAVASIVGWSTAKIMKIADGLN